MENQFTIREQIIEIVKKLFVYTDTRQWQRLIDEVFTGSVLFDMASIGAGDSAHIPAEQIHGKKGFDGIDSIPHLAGNYLVNLYTDEATVHAICHRLPL